MLVLLLLLFLMFVFMGAVSRSMSRRRRLIEDEQREAALRAPDRGANGQAPFPSPFDLLFGGMLGGGVRSYELDPETGRWAEVTDDAPGPDEEAEPPREDHPEPA